MTGLQLEPLVTLLGAVPSAVPLLVLLVKVTLLLLAALAATVAMQRSPAGARHLVWLVALAGVVILAPLGAWGPLPIPVLPGSALAAPALEAVPPPAEAAVPATGGSVLPSVPAGPVSHPAAAVSLSPAQAVVGLWAVVALILLGRLGYGAWSVRRIVRQARPLEDPSWQTPLYEISDRLGLAAAPRLLQSAEVKMPFAAGLVNPTIVLPVESEAWSAERRSAVLVHELGHVRRRDLVGHTLSRVVCAVYWFHPLVWTAARRLRAESERACDDLALVFGARPSEYAEHLLDIVTCVRHHNTPAVALAMAHRKEFEGRMLALLNPELRRRGPSRVESASLVGSLAVLAVALGGTAPVERKVPSEPDSSLVTLADSAIGAVPEAVREPAPASGPAPAGRASPDPRPAPSPSPTPAPSPNAAGQQDDDERAAALARTLRSDSSAEVRRVAAWGLQRYARTEVGRAALIAALGSDGDDTVREMAAWALASAGRDAAASAAVVQALGRDKSAAVRRTAVWAAGSIGDASAAAALERGLADQDPEVRELTAWALGNCRPDAAPAGLVRLLSDAARDVRLSAAWALYLIRDPRAAGALDAAFQRETDQEVQHGLIRALGALGDEGVPALQRLVNSPSPEVRAVAVRALAGGHAGGPWPWPRPVPRPFP